jgi:hypothetical protein
MRRRIEMKSYRKPFILMTILLFYFNFTLISYGLEIKTHEKINLKISGLKFEGFLLNSYLKNQLGFKDGIEEIYNKLSIKELLRDGGRYEDIPAWYLIYLRSVNHYHNPLTENGFHGWFYRGVLSGDSSKDWAQKPLGAQNPGGHYSWYDVRDYFYKGLTSPTKTEREKYFAETFRGLGQLMHLVQDASVPEHTRDDFHTKGYEKWVSNNIDINGISPTIFEKSILNRSTSDHPISNIFDTNRYNGTNPGETVGGQIGLTEYTNANFFSEDTINSTKFPYPKIKGNTTTDIRPYKGPSGLYDRQYFLKKCCGETNEGKGYLLSAVDYYDYWRNDPSVSLNLPPFPIPVLDENVYNEYAQFLLPRAIGYSAGLLGYFFRCELRVEQTDTKQNGDIEFTITNLTEDPLGAGLFYLFYDNIMGERKEIVLNGRLVLNLIQNGQQKVTFTPPNDFELGKKNQYMLVYKGQLGSEEMAIVGKYISEPIQLQGVMATYSFEHNKIFFKGNDFKIYIDLNGIVDNCNDGGGDNDRRYLSLAYGQPEISSLEGFSLLEENGKYGAFIIQWGNQTYIYKFKVTNQSQGNETYTWKYTDTLCYPSLTPGYPGCWTEFQEEYTYDKYLFEWVREELPTSSIGLMVFRGFKVYSNVGKNIRELDQLKWAIGGAKSPAFIGSADAKYLYWYDRGETNPSWHAIETGITGGASGGDIYNCVFALNDEGTAITDCIAAWNRPHGNIMQGFDYWDWYVTDESNATTYLYREYSPRRYGGANLLKWSPTDRKGGGIFSLNTDGTIKTDRVNIITGVIDWYGVGKTAYRLDGVWYTEDNVPSSYYPSAKYPFGAVRGKELLHGMQWAETLPCPAVDEKEIPWSYDMFRGFHHIKTLYWYYGRTFPYHTDAPMAYFKGRVYGQEDILGFSRVLREIDWEDEGKYGIKFRDYWNFISDFAVIPIGGIK